MRILTFDIEEWFHCDLISGDESWRGHEERIGRNVEQILSSLEERRQKATFFCLGWVVRNHAPVIQQIWEAGHEIGCHSDMHRPVFELDVNQFRTDTENALKSLEDCIGEKILLYRAPAFSITEACPWAFEVLMELGIEFDCSIFPASRDYGGFPTFGEAKPTMLELAGGRIKEFPINTVRLGPANIVFSGGGYFRLFPYRLIRNWTKRSPYIMSYFHPRDFDPGQPVLKHLPLHRRFKSYYGLHRSFAKFEHWLDEFSFVSVLEADKLVDWNAAPVCRIEPRRKGKEKTADKTVTG